MERANGKGEWRKRMERANGKGEWKERMERALARMKSGRPGVALSTRRFHSPFPLAVSTRLFHSPFPFAFSIRRLVLKPTTLVIGRRAVAKVRPCSLLDR